jgi:hypothetical protein
MTSAVLNTEVKLNMFNPGLILSSVLFTGVGVDTFWVCCAFSYINIDFTHTRTSHIQRELQVHKKGKLFSLTFFFLLSGNGHEVFRSIFSIEIR